MPKVSLPLLHDRHTHVSFYAALGKAVDLSSCTRLADALALLRRRKAPLVVARGWMNNHYDFPAAELDKLPPAVICNISLHCFAMNAAARRALAVRFPEVVRRMDDPAWTERNLPRVFDLFTVYGGAGELDGYMAGLAGLGVWAAGDMLVSTDEAALKLAGDYAGRVTLWAGLDGYKKLGRRARAAVHGIKLFADGALGARSAALKGRYRGGGSGLLLHTGAGLRRLIASAAALKDNVAVHAIGDAALEQVLKALEGPKAPRVPALRIEHAQLITLEQARRAKKLGLTLCMQPNFSADSVCYADRLPAGYLRANNPFRMLIDRAGFRPGADLVFGSDGMPHGAAAALEGALFPPFAGQRLSLDEFRAGYCLPDMKAGRLELTVDEAARRVSVKVRLAA